MMRVHSSGVDDERCYAGDRSEQFWRRVNRLKPTLVRNEIYSLGCILQSLETYVLRRLSEAEAVGPKRAKRRKKAT